MAIAAVCSVFLSAPQNVPNWTNLLVLLWMPSRIVRPFRVPWVCARVCVNNEWYWWWRCADPHVVTMLQQSDEFEVQTREKNASVQHQAEALSKNTHAWTVVIYYATPIPIGWLAGWRSVWGTSSSRTRRHIHKRSDCEKTSDHNTLEYCAWVACVFFARTRSGLNGVKLETDISASKDVRTFAAADLWLHLTRFGEACARARTALIRHQTREIRIVSSSIAVSEFSNRTTTTHWQTAVRTHIRWSKNKLPGCQSGELAAAVGWCPFVCVRACVRVCVDNRALWRARTNAQEHTKTTPLDRMRACINRARMALVRFSEHIRVFWLRFCREMCVTRRRASDARRLLVCGRTTCSAIPRYRRSL